jgi:TonB family protein
MLVLYFLVFAMVNPAQDLPPVSAATDYARMHLGVNPPKLIHSSDPQYTPEALAAGIEGSVVLQAIVDVKGYVAYASVLSPLPAGLDAKALAAVKHWRFSPAVMDNEVIPLLTTIDVVFRLPYNAHPEKPHPQAAADLERSAFLGNADAQQKIAERSERAGNRTEAQHYFRLCAATGHAVCQFRLGRLLVSGPDVNPDSFAQGVAWLELAKQHGNPDAAWLWEASESKLSSVQLDWVAQLKPHLELKNFRGF